MGSKDYALVFKSVIVWRICRLYCNELSHLHFDYLLHNINLIPYVQYPYTSSNEAHSSVWRSRLLSFSLLKVNLHVWNKYTSHNTHTIVSLYIFFRKFIHLKNTLIYLFYINLIQWCHIAKDSGYYSRQKYPTNLLLPAKAKAKASEYFSNSCPSSTLSAP